jgi:hypothetical protein
MSSKNKPSFAQMCIGTTAIESGIVIDNECPMETLAFKDANSCRWDCASPGEVMLRLDPGEGRIHTARQFPVWEGSGEYNVVRGFSESEGRCLHLAHRAHGIGKRLGRDRPEHGGVEHVAQRDVDIPDCVGGGAQRGGRVCFDDSGGSSRFRIICERPANYDLQIAGMIGER